MIPKFRVFYYGKIHDVIKLYWFLGADGQRCLNVETIGYHIDSREPEFKGLMQWTGLVDRNEEDIYSAHIVKFTKWWFDGQERETELIGVIIYEPEKMAFALKGIKNKEWLKHTGGCDTISFAFLNFDQSNFEVIGNIYENPELLEGAEHV